MTLSIGPDEKFDCEWLCSSDAGIHRNCTVHNPTRTKELDESFEKDQDRWIEGYVTQSTQAVRNRVLAATNGSRV
jgi:hypothetical protein